MRDINDEILDYEPKKPKQPAFITILFIIAILLFAYWLFIPNSWQYPFRKAALVFGLIILAIISTLRFIYQSNKSKSATAIFIGQLFLITGIFVVFTKLPYTTVFIAGAGVSFLLGIILKD